MALASNVLRIADDFTLPLDAVTETFVILAKRGSGKTYTAAVLVEELVGAGQPVVVIDPVGVWYGLRSSADGQDPGLPVVIFGGDHADLPLQETAGILLADLIVDRRIPAVLDLSGLSKSASRRFVADFLERLYHRNRDPLHVVVDEADMFAPQRADRGQERLLGSMEDLVRRGRARGIGVTLITQRPAVLHKDVLSQAEVLVALRMTGVRDVGAIDEWVRLHAEDDDAAALKRSLPSLPIGHAWIWSPGWLSVMQRVAVRRRHTFDSSATPKAGETRVTPERMADVDLEALGAQLAEQVEQAANDDPAALRRRISTLEVQLDRATHTQPEPVRVEIPVIPDATLELFEGMIADLKKHGEQMLHVAIELAVDLRATREDIPASHPSPPARQHPRPISPAVKKHDIPPAGAAQSPDGQLLTKAERNLLIVLAQHGQRSQQQISILSSYSLKSSSFKNALSGLRVKGYATGGQVMAITPEGVAAVGDYDPLPTGADLITLWYGKLGKAERALLGLLVDAHPDPMTYADLAQRSGYSPTSSSFKNALSRLRVLNLAHGTQLMTADDTLIGD